MKKLYIYLLLCVASTTSFAQTDIALNRWVTKALVPHSDSLLHFEKNTDSFVVNPTTPVNYAFRYFFINNGPNALTPSDTLHLKSPWVYGSTFSISLGGLTSFAVHDTIWLQGAPIKTFNSVATASGSYLFCDSVWATHQNGAVITDPVPSNNDFCTTNYIKVFKTGVEQLTNNVPNGLSIYPNPATSNINFNYDFTGASKATLMITDVVGRTVYQEELTDLGNKKTVTVNINSYTPGVYLAILVVDDTRVVGKFNVQK
ncbi:MAG: T9SS type A sorting domain-containing protein [Flavipsychrobacter sp.]|nr:T9SS type A sorting domain-containing protein [Flavipsychrobacter sp.]